MRQLVVLALVACGSKDASPPAAGSSAPRDAAVTVDAAVAVAPDACKRALAAAPKQPATRRAQAILDGCQPCGDWTPLLAWAKPPDRGGPSRQTIEAAMTACRGFCDAGAKQRFLGTLEKARGKDTRGPWRHLGELCKDKVSAVPDTRYASAPLFALDRIARDAAARPELAPLLAAIELPMPAVSISGSGVELPSSPVTAPDAGAIALTVTATEVRIASVPRAKLTQDGVVLVATGELYPGERVTDARALRAALKRHAPGGSPAFLTVFAPQGLPAARLVDVLRLVDGHDVRLAVTARGAPEGWTLPGTIPLAIVGSLGKAGTTTTLVLDTDPDAVIQQAKDTASTRGPVSIRITPRATFAGLAKLLGALTFFDLPRVAVLPAKP